MKTVNGKIKQFVYIFVGFCIAMLHIVIDIFLTRDESFFIIDVLFLQGIHNVSYKVDPRFSCENST
jgi:hypothetical protein